MQSLLFLGTSFLLALAKSVDLGILKNNVFHLSVGHVNTNAYGINTNDKSYVI